MQLTNTHNQSIVFNTSTWYSAPSYSRIMRRQYAETPSVNYIFKTTDAHDSRYRCDKPSCKCDQVGRQKMNQIFVAKRLFADSKTESAMFQFCVCRKCGRIFNYTVNIVWLCAQLNPIIGERSKCQYSYRQLLCRKCDCYSITSVYYSMKFGRYFNTTVEKLVTYVIHNSTLVTVNAICYMKTQSI